MQTKRAFLFKWIQQAYLPQGNTYSLVLSSGSFMTTLSKNHPAPAPDESWPTRTFWRPLSDTASIWNSSTLKAMRNYWSVNNSTMLNVELRWPWKELLFGYSGNYMWASWHVHWCRKFSLGWNTYRYDGLIATEALSSYSRYESHTLDIEWDGCVAVHTTTQTWTSCNLKIHVSARFFSTWHHFGRIWTEVVRKDRMQ